MTGIPLGPTVAVAERRVSLKTLPLPHESLTLAGLPLAALAGGSVALLLSPVANLLSRRHERRADAYALEVTGKPDALESGLRRVAAQRLAEERPTRIVEWLFHAHPPLSDRLAAARSSTHRS